MYMHIQRVHKCSYKYKFNSKLEYSYNIKNEIYTLENNVF